MKGIEGQESLSDTYALIIILHEQSLIATPKPDCLDMQCK